MAGHFTKNLMKNKQIIDHGIDHDNLSKFINNKVTAIRGIQRRYSISEIHLTSD